MSKYLEHLLSTPGQMHQTDPRQVQNSAGGYVFAVTPWQRLDRFLILGSDSNSYYATAKQLTVDNAAAVVACLKEDGARTVLRIREISESGRAPKNDPAVLALALALVHGDKATQAVARSAILPVCRTGTHFLQLVKTIDALRGWGRSIKRAVASWYLDQKPDDLLFQLMKYQERGGWSHRDVLRLCHPRASAVRLRDVVAAAERQTLLRWAVRQKLGERTIQHGDKPARTYPAVDPLPPRLEAFEALCGPGIAPGDASAIIVKYRLPFEVVPGPLLERRVVWEALLGHMPLGATLRNLGQLTARGIVAEGSAWASTLAERLTDGEALKRARIHPLHVLSALRVYQAGHGKQLAWKPVKQVTSALESAFYLAFANVEPTHKRVLLALDVSGSMAIGEVGGVPGLTPREASAAMAMVIARTEPNHALVAYAEKMIPLDIRPDMRLRDVVAGISGIPFGRTDCAQPLVWANRQKKEFDAVVSLTDSETWAGPIQVPVALAHYRKLVPGCKLIPVAMVANAYTVGDPNDPGTLNVVGFDAAAPLLIADFIRTE